VVLDDHPEGRQLLHARCSGAHRARARCTQELAGNNVGSAGDAQCKGIAAAVGARHYASHKRACTHGVPRNASRSRAHMVVALRRSRRTAAMQLSRMLPAMQGGSDCRDRTVAHHIVASAAQGLRHGQGLVGLA
jgi:hypothetical protein